MLDLDPRTARVVIVGGPKRGKSTLSREFLANGFRVFCTDQRSMVAEPIDGCTYLPEGLDWSASSAYVAEHWLTQPGPWVVEGVATARALRKWADAHESGLPCERIVFLRAPKVTTTKPQEAMAKGIDTVWAGISKRFGPITETR